MFIHEGRGHKRHCLGLSLPEPMEDGVPNVSGLQTTQKRYLMVASVETNILTYHSHAGRYQLRRQPPVT